MQTAFSLPTDQRFFNRYATLIPTLSKLGLFAQILNGLCEFGVIHAIVLGHIAGLFGAFAGPLAFVAAVFGVAILEIGQRTFLPYSARAVLYRRFAGLDLVMSVAIFAVCAGLFGSSLYLAFNGSRDLVEHLAPPPPLLDEATADQAHRTAKSEAASAWKLDSAEITNRYAGLIGAARAATAAKVATHQREITELQAKERKTGQSYASLRNAQGDKISALNAELAGIIADLEGQKANEMQQAKQRRTVALDAAANTRADVTGKNETTRSEARAKVAGYGSGLGWFTVIFHFVLLLSIVLQEVHRKGAGIELRAMPNQYHFSESVGAKFANMLNEKWNYHARAWIDRLADRTPPPPIPKTPRPLYDAPEMRMQAPAPAGAQDAPTGGNKTPVNPDVPAWARSQYQANGRAKNMAANGDAISRTAPARDNAIRYDWDAPLSEPIVKIVEVDPSLKPCKHCQSLFRPRTTWNVYCSEQCKLDAHEAKHGARFDPGKAKFKRAAAHP